MLTSFELYPQPVQIQPEGQYRSCLIKQTSDDGNVTEKTLWYLYPHNIPLPENDHCDSYLLASLLPAMKLGAMISIHGIVSKKLLANLTELQLVWSRWCPDLYSLIDIKVEEISQNSNPVDGAVVAFSGGIDASFSAYRHAKAKAGYATQPLKAGVLVHGFDIPLSDEIGFKGATKKANMMLKDLDLRLITTKTNIRELFDINWEHHCGLAVASTLNNLNMYAGTGLIASGESYDLLQEPWGSHPLTDHLCSSYKFQIIHDGAGFSRIDKLNLLLQWPSGLKDLRVCWAGGENDRNCGICEKCIRTKLNFILVEEQNPKCFTSPLQKSDLKRVALRSEASRAEWKLIHDKIIETKNGIEFLDDVKKVLKRKPSAKLSFILPINSKRRKFVKNIVNKVKR